MIDLVGWVVGGLAAFLVMLAGYLPLRPGDRAPEALAASAYAISLVGVLLIAFDLVYVDPGGKLPAIARGVALCLGFASGYLVYQLFWQHASSSAHPRLMPHEYKAASRRLDEVFRRMRAEAAGAPILPDDGQKLLKLFAILVIAFLATYLVIKS